MIDLSLIEKNHGNERDIEIAGVLTLYEKYRKNIKEMLDVGCHWSHATYAPALKALSNKVSVYDGCDIAPDEKTAGIIDHYFVGNVADLPLEPYDFVFSISSLEHSGLSTYKAEDWLQERKRVLKAVNKLAKKYLFITVPYGLENVIEGQYANFTWEHLEWFKNYLMAESVVDKKPITITNKFYFCDKLGDPYREIPKKEADNIPFDNTGVRCNLFLLVDKT